MADSLNPDPVVTNIDLTEPPTSATAPEPTPPAPLLAGKFKTPADLEKAYKELETKLGTASKTDEPAPPAKDDNADAQTQQQQPEITVAGLPATKYFKEFDETGALSEDSYKELSDKGIPKEIVDAYIEGQKARISQHQALSEQAEKSLMDQVGGEAEFTKMRQWAETTGYSAEEKAAYQKAIESGDPTIAAFAVRDLKARYSAAFGHAPNLIQGAPSAGTVGYQSRNEMVMAMKDPRYGADPAYTKEVELKVAAMNM